MNNLTIVYGNFGFLVFKMMPWTVYETTSKIILVESSSLYDFINFSWDHQTDYFNFSMCYLVKITELLPWQVKVSGSRLWQQENNAGPYFLGMYQYFFGLLVQSAGLRGGVQGLKVWKHDFKITSDPKGPQHVPTFW